MELFHPLNRLLDKSIWVDKRTIIYKTITPQPNVSSNTHKLGNFITITSAKHSLHHLRKIWSVKTAILEQFSSCAPNIPRRGTLPQCMKRGFGLSFTYRTAGIRKNSSLAQIVFRGKDFSTSLPKEKLLYIWDLKLPNAFPKEAPVPTE